MKLKKFANALPEEMLKFLRYYSLEKGVKIWRIIYDALVLYFKNRGIKWDQ